MKNVEPINQSIIKKVFLIIDYKSVILITISILKDIHFKHETANNVHVQY